MSFDPQSIERLKQLGRQLPKELPTPHISSNKEPRKNSTLHPIETEKDPQALFRELMKASPDGEVPPHLIARLKEIETKQLTQANTLEASDTGINTSKGNSSSRKINTYQKNNQFKQRSEEIDLYTSFKRLLLEEEDDN